MRDTLFIGAAAIAMGVAMFGLVSHAQDEARAWEAFKVAHHCKVTGRMDGEVFSTFSSGGQVGIGSTSSKTAWTCDDGVTYWK